MEKITEYKNGTKLLVLIKQSDGKTFEAKPGESITADPGAHFTHAKYPNINRWFRKINAGKIRTN